MTTAEKEVKNTAKVDREMVERAGINADKLLEPLIKNAAELTTYYLLYDLRSNPILHETERCAL
ncbi:hypothetical protein DRP05_09825 [Archaeoglobales archaeon]|nr:MAG: hypothetical protein DRP05_09825 [Archaeoglobales archaeon]